MGHIFNCSTFRIIKLVEDIGYEDVPTVEYLGAGDVDGSSYIFQGKNDAHEMTHAAVSGLEDE